MRVGYLQTAPIFGEKNQNFEEARTLVGRLPRTRAVDLLVLPELFATGYTFTSRDEAKSLAEPADGPTAAFLKEVSAITGGTVVAGFAESDGDRVYNSSLIVSGGAILGTYRKIHLYNREKLWFDPGDRRPVLYEAAGARFGVMICFDWMFPEVMRVMMLSGAQIAAHPANLVLPYCQEAMKTRCLENRMFAVTANRIGREERGDDAFFFTGASQITDIDGAALSTAPAKEAFADITDIDPARAASKRLNAHNDLVADRRVDFYSTLTDTTAHPEK